MSDDPITVFDEERTHSLLAEESLGRLVTVVDGRAEIFPVNYATSEGRIYFRTAEGTKLADLTVHPDVVFQVDHITGTEAWSVVVRGTARMLQSFQEINDAEELDLKPWIPTLKYNFVEISPTSVSGRGFRFGDEPDRYVG